MFCLRVLSEPWPEPRPGTVAAIIAAYVQQLRLRVACGDYSAQALQDAQRELNRFAGRYGEQEMSACRRHDLTQWLAANPQWQSNGTKLRVLATICACFHWAAEEELIQASPYRKPRTLKLPTTPRREASEREYICLLRAPSRPLRRALFFLRRTGARTCEMRELLWDEIDWEAGIVEKDRHKTRRYTGRPRLFGLEPCVLRFLKNLQRQAPPAQRHVFVNCQGGAWDRHTFARHLRRWAQRLGLDDQVANRVSAYCFRHSFTTWAIEAGVGERQIADQLGHKDTRMIAWYSKAAQKRRHLRDVATQAVKRKK